MDHIPHPEDVDPVQIPYYGDLYYRRICLHNSLFGRMCLQCRSKSKTGWINFWSRFKLDVAFLLDRRFEVLDVSCKSNLALIMFAWLYFGVLSEYFEHTVDLRRFKLRSGDGPAGPRYMTTRELPRILDDWHTKMQRRSQKQYEKWAKSTEDLFASVYKICMTCLQEDPEIFQMLPANGRLALHLLYDILLTSKSILDGGAGPQYNIWRLAGPQLLEQLRTLNWCPSQEVNVAFCVSVAYSATLLGQRDRLDHSNCDKHTCQRSQVDAATYIVRHALGCSIDAAASSNSDRASEDESCDEADLVRIIENDLVPLITADADGHVHVVGSRPEDGRYVAISHVWGDGGGNPRANSLPRCQIKLICSQLEHLKADYNESTPIFLDTLCVPVGEAQRTESARRKLITKMWAIYKHASVVVIRDQSLMECSKDLSFHELIFRIALSPWSSRLWTMQEGAVAAKLKVVMANGMIAMEKLYDGYLNDGEKTFPRWRVLSRGGIWMGDVIDIWSFLATTRLDFRPFRSDSLSSESKRQIAFDMAQHRRTSKLKDELMCIGGIIGFTEEQLSTMSDKSDSERTEWVIEKLERVPQNLVLVDGPRLQSRGFRWCPERIARNWDSTDPEFHEVRAGEGLYGKWKTVFFTAPRGFCNELTRQRPDRGIMDLGDYLFMLRPESSGLFRGPSSILIGIVSDEGLEEFRALEGQSLALLTPVKLSRGNILERSIFVVRMSQDISATCTVGNSSTDSSSISSTPSSVDPADVGYGTRQMACRAIWESDQCQINWTSTTPSITASLWDSPYAERFWLVD